MSFNNFIENQLNIFKYYLPKYLNGAILSVDEATDAQKPAITNSEKILLLLSDFHGYENEYRVPEEISQNGISRVIRIKRCNVARELIKLKKKAPNLRGTIVLVTHKQKTGGYGEFPGYFIKGVVYGPEPLDEEEEAIKRERSLKKDAAL